MKPQLFSGARGRISFRDSGGNSQTLALVTDLTITDNAGLRPTFVVGAEGPVSIEPLAMDVTASIGRIIPMNKQADSSALDRTTSIDLGFEEIFRQILAKDHVEITVEDKNPADPSKPQILGVVRYARFSGRTTALNAGDVGSERYNFVGIFDAGYNATSNAPEDINYGLE